MCAYVYACMHTYMGAHMYYVPYKLQRFKLKRKE